jgi:hypothetical protein
VISSYFPIRMIYLGSFGMVKQIYIPKHGSLICTRHKRSVPIT